MIRLFGHYVSPALLGLLGAEVLLLFGSFALGPVLWRAWSERVAGPEWAVVLPNALVCTLILGAILIALGLYEHRFWRGRTDMLLRVGVGFLFGLFALALVGWLFPVLESSRGELSLALGLAGAGVALLRWGFLRATGRAVFQFRVLVVGIGEQAARLETLSPSAALSCQILGYVQVHEDETPAVPVERRLQVTQRLVDLAVGLRIDEIVVALDDQRRGFPLDELLECKLAGIAIRSALAFVERETGQIALEALRPSSLLFADGFPARPAVFDPQVSHQAGRRRCERRRVHPARRSPCHAGRPAAAGNPHRRAAPVGQRAARRDEPGRAAPGTAALRGRTAGGDPVLGLRHLGQPGLTGWAQICYPYADSEESSREKLRYDLYYLKNASFGFDLLILLQTVHAVLRGSGAR